MSRAEDVKCRGSPAERGFGFSIKGDLGTKAFKPRMQEGMEERVPGARSLRPTPSASLRAPRTPEAQFRSLWIKRVADAIFRPLLKGAGDVATAGDARKYASGLARVGKGGARTLYKSSS